MPSYGCPSLIGMAVSFSLQGYFRRGWWEASWFSSLAWGWLCFHPFWLSPTSGYTLRKSSLTSAEGSLSAINVLPSDRKNCLNLTFIYGLLIPNENDQFLTWTFATTLQVKLLRIGRSKQLSAQRALKTAYGSFAMGAGGNSKDDLSHFPQASLLRSLSSSFDLSVRFLSR